MGVEHELFSDYFFNSWISARPGPCPQTWIVSCVCQHSCSIVATYGDIRADVVCRAVASMQSVGLSFRCGVSSFTLDRGVFFPFFAGVPLHEDRMVSACE